MKTLWVVAALLLAETSAIRYKHQQKEFDFDENLANEDKEAHAQMAFTKLAQLHQEHMKSSESLIKEYTHQIDQAERNIKQGILGRQLASGKVTAIK